MNILVVIQQYEAEVNNEYVIRGNSAIMKCEIPSYVSDFIVVDMWTDSDGGSYHPNNDIYGTHLSFTQFAQLYNCEIQSNCVPFDSFSYLFALNSNCMIIFCSYSCSGCFHRIQSK